MTDDGTTGQPSGADKPYNPIFERLVDNSDDSDHELVGLVAYALYKRSKRHWVQNFKLKHGRQPMDADFEIYIDSWTPDRIDGLRNEAASALAGYGAVVVAEARPAIMRDAIRGTFSQNVKSSMLANLLYTVGLIIFALIIYFAGIDLLGILSNVGPSTAK